MRATKHLIVVVTVAMMGLSAGAQTRSPAQSVWKTLSTEAFSIETPGRPVRELKKLDTVLGPTPAVLHTVDRGDEAFLIMYQDFPPSKYDFNGAGLDGLRKGYLKMGGTIVSERTLSIGEYAGRELAFTDKNGVFFVAWAFSVEPRLYQILFTTSRGTRLSANGSRFLRSFRLNTEYAKAQSERRIAYDSTQLARDLTAEFPYFSKRAISLMSAEIMRQRMTPEQVGAFGLEIMSRGVSLLDADAQNELQSVRDRMFSMFTTDELAIYNSLYKKATSGQALTKEERAYVNLLFSKAFNSLSDEDKRIFQDLMEQALTKALGP